MAIFLKILRHLSLRFNFIARILRHLSLRFHHKFANIYVENIFSHSLIPARIGPRLPNFLITKNVLLSHLITSFEMENKLYYIQESCRSTNSVKTFEIHSYYKSIGNYLPMNEHSKIPNISRPPPPPPPPVISPLNRAFQSYKPMGLYSGFYGSIVYILLYCYLIFSDY